MQSLIRRAGARCATLGLAILLTACSEQLTAPGSCPDFCSTSTLSVIDTVLPGAITQDSSFGRPIGYVSPAASFYLPAVSGGPRESRPIFRTVPAPARVVVNGDTVTGAVVGVDSLRLTITILQRDTSAHDLVLSLYALPVTIDSSTAFHDLDASFAAPAVRSLNLDSLLAKPGLRDPVTRDSAVVDTTGRITLFIGLDSAQAPLVIADSGKLALGIRVSANTRPRLAFASEESTTLSPSVTWYFKADSQGVRVIHPPGYLSAISFDSFVFDPPTQATGALLVVGGVPAARSVLRLTLPRAIRDSSRVVRATLEFVPAALLEGTAADSFAVVAHPVVADFGAKSPLNYSHTDTTWIPIAPVDTVRIDVTNVLSLWATDSLQATTLVLRQIPEGALFPELRMHSTLDAGQAPTLRITYAPRYPIRP